MDEETKINEKENGKLEVLNREFIWQNGEDEQQIVQEFPPKEWWDGEEIGDDFVEKENGTEKKVGKFLSKLIG